MNILKPTYAYASVVDMPLDQIKGQQPNLGAISWDLDGTLVEHLGEGVPAEHLEIIEWADQLGLAQAIISNAYSESRSARVEQIAAQICRDAGVELVTVDSREVKARKPKPLIFRAAADKLGIDPADILHTGDQIARDVIGPNISGYRGAVLVAPYGGTRDEGWPVRRMQRPVEKIMRIRMGLPYEDQPSLNGNSQIY